MESVWGDIRNKSLGKEVRTEDIGATLVIDGEKYTFMHDFWGMGDTYNEENSDEWTCFAFNKMPDGSKQISGDTDEAGVFGIDKYDIGDWDYDIYVLKDYFEYTDEELAQRAIDDCQLYNADYFVQSILEKYVKDVFKNHMSEYAYFWIYELRDSVMDNNMVISLYTPTEGSAEMDAFETEFPDREIEEAHIYLYPDFDGWYEGLEKELMEAYEKEGGWVKSEKYEPDYDSGLPGKSRGIAFVKFKD